jgi:hypothetical protein
MSYCGVGGSRVYFHYQTTQEKNKMRLVQNHIQPIAIRQLCRHFVSIQADGQDQEFVSEFDTKDEAISAACFLEDTYEFEFVIYSSHLEAFLSPFNF